MAASGLKMSGGFFKMLVLLSVTSVSCNSRVKRYLTYPPNSAIVLTMSLLKIMPPAHGVNSMTEFDLFHPLPEKTKQAQPGRGKHRRERREILQQLENILEDREFDGRSCIQKAICEARSMNLSVEEDNLVKELFQFVFQPLDDGSYACNQPAKFSCSFSPLHTVLAWAEHFRQQTFDLESQNKII